jgi:hypothetical protein
MKFSFRSNSVRWAAAAMVAAGAVTLATADGLAADIAAGSNGLFQRLYVAVWATGPAGACDLSYPWRYYGGAQANSASNVLMCDVSASATIGTTNRGATYCPITALNGLQPATLGTWTGTIREDTGEFGDFGCISNNVPWGSTSNCSGGPWWSSCTVNATAEGH